MPAVGGTEEPLEHRRLTDSYFKILNEEWQPKIIDDPHLPFQVYQAGKNINWSQRETVISRMLFETGARASEIIELTIEIIVQEKATKKSLHSVKVAMEGR